MTTQHIDQQEQRVAGYKTQAKEDLALIVQQTAKINAQAAEIARLTTESDERLKDAVAQAMEIERLRAALRTIAEPQGCALGCTVVCQAKVHGCASECPALPWQPQAQPERKPVDRMAWDYEQNTMRADPNGPFVCFADLPAQPQGEAVAWMTNEEQPRTASAYTKRGMPQASAESFHIPLFTHPAHTEEEVQELLIWKSASGPEFQAKVRRILGMPAP